MNEKTILRTDKERFERNYEKNIICMCWLNDFFKRKAFKIIFFRRSDEKWFESALGWVTFCRNYLELISFEAYPFF